MRKYFSIFFLLSEYVSYTSNVKPYVLKDHFYGIWSGLPRQVSLYAEGLPNEHSTRSPLDDVQRPVNLRRPVASQLLNGIELSCIVGLQRMSRGLSLLSLLLYPLTLLCAFWFSASLVLAANSQLDALFKGTDHLVPLSGYRRKANCVLSPLIATRGLLEGHRM